MDHTHNNAILDRLDEHTFRQIAPRLLSTDLKAGQILALPFQRVNAVYFPLNAVASFLVPLASGRMVEAGMVGRDGVVAAEEALHDAPAFSQVVVQVPGQGLVVSAHDFRELHSEHKALRDNIATFRKTFVAQIQQSAVCNSVHHTDARLCRWLLRLRDLAGDEFFITQNFMADMLGVQRASVSVQAGKLQEAGLINYRRGHIKIADLGGLRNSACECYGHMKRYEHAVLSSREELEEA